MLITPDIHPALNPQKIMKRKTILHIEVINSEYTLQYSGSIAQPPTSKEDFKHDERIMRMLASDRKVFDFFYRLVEPARRFYIREEKKKLKTQVSSK